MKISKRVREEAALICAIAASTECGRRPVFLSDVRDFTDLPLSLDAQTLAYQATKVTEAEVYDHKGNFHIVDAEAESLLRSGWCPGDEV